MSLTAAYKQAGFVLANPRNHWSAVDEAGGRVALTVWSDQIDKTAEPWTYDVGAGRDPSLWIDRVGNQVRKRHIEFALGRKGARFHLILVKAVDPNAEPRKVDWARHWHQRMGVIDLAEFDPVSGVFVMRLLPTETTA